MPLFWFSNESGSHVILCRINGFGPSTGLEVEAAIKGGANEILLPMVREPREVIHTLRLIRDRAKLGILIETRQAAYRAAEFAALPLSRIYFGLNDLAIDLGNRSLFRALYDGTVDRIRGELIGSSIPLGIGGMTLPEFGSPIPCSLLAGEIVRLGASFTFLRRSFMRDIHGRRIEIEIPRMLAEIERNRARPAAEVEHDRLAFTRAAQAAEGAPRWMAAAAG